MKKPCNTSIVQKGYFKPSIKGTYPTLNSYAKNNQHIPEPESEPKLQVKKQKQEDPVEFASMIVNLDDDTHCETPKFDNLLVIIEGYMAYINSTCTEAKYKPNLKISPHLLKELDAHFDFKGLSFWKKFFKKAPFFTCSRYKVEIFYARFNPELQKICDEKLKVLSKMNEQWFLEKLERCGYISEKTH